MEKKRIVILGCENSHAATFLGFLRDRPEKYPDIEVAGVFSEFEGAGEKLAETFGVPLRPSFDCLAGSVDGVAVTARRGADHLRFARPYIRSGVPMFIDKPITASEDEAVELAQTCKAAGVRLTGGSCCVHCDMVRELKAKVASAGALGGFVRAPSSLENDFGGFSFYAQHPVEILCEIFGRYPSSVSAVRSPAGVSALIRYPQYDVPLLMTDKIYVYSAYAALPGGTEGGDFPVTSKSPCFADEFDAFASLLRGKDQPASYEDFIAPVFVINALERSLLSGAEEPVRPVPAL